MMIVNVSSGKINYSQRNNAVKPFSSCNVTSMVMALDYMGFAFPKGIYEQPEDNLRLFIQQNGGNPENHYALSDCTNKWLGKQVTAFSTERSIAAIMKELRDGRPVVISGTFPGYPELNRNKQTGEVEPLGHIVCLVGYEYKNEHENPHYVIWDDPYGNTLENWKGTGNDVKVDYRLFIDWIKPYGNSTHKWGHFFYKGDI